MKSWLKANWPDFVLITLLTTLAVYFTWPIWSTTFSGGTDSLGHIYKASFLAGTWKTGGPFYPLWSSTWYAGYPFLQLYSPLAYYVMAVVSFFTGNNALAAKTLIVLAYVASGWSMYAAAKILTKNRWAAFFAGAAFILFPFRTTHAIASGNLPFMLAISFAPLMLVSYIKASNKLTVRKTILAAVLAVMVLLSHHNTFFLFVLVLGVYSTWAVLFKDRDNHRLVILFEHVRAAIGVGVMTALFSAFWLLPFATKARSALITEYSATVVRGSAIKSAVLYLRQYQAGNYIYIGAYVGVFVLLMIMIAMLGTGLRRDKIAWFFATIGFGSLALALVKDARVFTYLPLGKMIVPDRMLYISAVALPILFGLSVKELAAVSKIRKGNLRVAAFGVLAIVISAGLWIDFGSIREILGVSYKIPASYQKYIDRTKTIRGYSRMYETQWAWNTYAYTPALTGRESLDGWYVEGAAIRGSLSIINSSLKKEKNPRAIPSLLSLFNTRYTLVPRKSVSRDKLMRTKQFYSYWRTNRYDLLALKDKPAAAGGRTPVLAISSNPADQYLLTAALSGGGDFVFAPGPSALLDKYLDASDFQTYPAVFLYGYDYMANRPDEGVWQEYVKNGGVMFVCPEGSPDSSKKQTRVLYDAGIKITKAAKKTKWSVTTNGVKAGLDESMFKKFSPAVWRGKPWSYCYFENIDSLVRVNGKTVVGQKRIGRGRVVFIGFNLPYHAAYYKNADEAAVLCSIIENNIDTRSAVEVTQFSKKPWGEIKLRAESVDKRPAWLLVSEAYDPGWAATVNGRPVKIKEADPPLMLIRLNGADKYDVVLQYKASVWHYIGIATSAAGILAALVFISSKRLREWAEG